MKLTIWFFLLLLPALTMNMGCSGPVIVKEPVYMRGKCWQWASIEKEWSTAHSICYKNNPYLRGFCVRKRSHRGACHFHGTVDCYWTHKQ